MDVLKMVVYLLLLQSLPLTAIYSSNGEASNQRYNAVIVAQVCLLVAFWLFFGGYAVDSWRFLTGFWSPYLNYGNEQGFWITGNLLSRIVIDPWPVKIMAAAGTFMLSLALLRFFGSEDKELRIIALFLLPIVPAYFLTYGNVLRQGLGATIVVVGILCFLNRRYLLFLSCVLLGVLFHNTSPVLAAALLAAFYCPGLAVPALVALPWVSFTAYYVLQLFDVDLGIFVKYAYYDEGSFHYMKFLVGYSAAWIVWVVSKNWDSHRRVLALTYVYVVAISSMILKYEVPFERLLLYGDFLLLFLIPLICRQFFMQNKKVIVAAWCVTTTAGVFLWTHSSVSRTLGYG
jgi:hypothetical protein